MIFPGPPAPFLLSMEWHRILPNRQQPTFGASEARHLPPRTRDGRKPSVFFIVVGGHHSWLAAISWDRGSCRSLFSRSSVSSLHWSDIQGLDQRRLDHGKSWQQSNRPCQKSRFNLRRVSASAKQGRCNGGKDRHEVGKKVKIKHMSHLQALVPSHNLSHLDFSLSPYTACWWWTSCTPSAPLLEPPDSPTLAWVWRGWGPRRGAWGRRGCSGGTQTPLVSRQGWPNAPNPHQSRRRVCDSQTRPPCIASVPIRQPRKYLTGLDSVLTASKIQDTKKTIQCQNLDSSPPTLGPISL